MIDKAFAWKFSSTNFIDIDGHEKKKRIPKASNVYAFFLPLRFYAKFYSYLTAGFGDYISQKNLLNFSFLKKTYKFASYGQGIDIHITY